MRWMPLVSRVRVWHRRWRRAGRASASCSRAAARAAPPTSACSRCSSASACRSTHRRHQHGRDRRRRLRERHERRPSMETRVASVSTGTRLFEGRGARQDQSHAAQGRRPTSRRSSRSASTTAARAAEGRRHQRRHSRPCCGAARCGARGQLTSTSCRSRSAPSPPTSSPARRSSSSEGDLAAAMRASMSVPGAFAPAEFGGRCSVDGGLTNNLPVDVARAMGADIVIAVNLGTPLASASRSTRARRDGADDQHPDRAERAARPRLAEPARHPDRAGAGRADLGRLQPRRRRRSWASAQARRAWRSSTSCALSVDAATYAPVAAAAPEACAAPQAIGLRRVRRQHADAIRSASATQLADARGPRPSSRSAAERDARTWPPAATTCVPTTAW